MKFERTSGRILQTVVLWTWTVLAAVALVCMALRFRYPYALEWMEGNQWYFAHRLEHGLPVYGDPNVTGFLPYPYPPLYSCLAALAMRVLGDALWPARLVTMLCTLTAAVLVGRAVWRPARDRPGAWIAACLFLGLYPVLDTWYDVLRGDMLYVALTLGAFVLWARREDDAGHALGAFLLLGLATFVKQPALIVLLVSTVWYASRRGPRWPWVMFVALMTVGLAHLALDRVTHGFYGFWVWRLPSGHGLEWRALIPGGLGRAAWIAGLPLVAAWLQWRDHPAGGAVPGHASWMRFLPGSVWGLALLASFVACAVTYAKVGATINNWILFAAVASVIAGRALASARRRVGRPRTLVYAMLLLQAALCLRDPRRLVPTAGDRAAGDRIVAMLRDIPGEVYVMDDAAMALQAGKTPYIGGMTLGDLSYAGVPPPSALLDRLRRAEFTAVLLRFDATESRYTQPVAAAIRAGYSGRKVAIPYPDERTFLPVAGGRYKPRWLLFRPSLD